MAERIHYTRSAGYYIIASDGQTMHRLDKDDPRVVAAKKAGTIVDVSDIGDILAPATSVVVSKTTGKDEAGLSAVEKLQLETQVSTLTTELASAHARVKELETSHEAATAQITKIIGERDQAWTDIKELNKKLEHSVPITPEEYAKLETQVAALESRKQQLDESEKAVRRLREFEPKLTAARREADSLTQQLKAVGEELEEEKKKKVPPASTASTAAAAGRSSFRLNRRGLATVAVVLLLLLFVGVWFGHFVWVPTPVGDQSAQIAQLQKDVGDAKASATDAVAKRDAALAAQKTDESKLETDDQEIKNLNGQLKELQDKDRVAKVETPPPPAPAPTPTPAPAQPEVSVAPAPTSPPQVQQPAVADAVDSRCSNVPGLVWINGARTCVPWPPAKF